MVHKSRYDVLRLYLKENMCSIEQNQVPRLARTPATERVFTEVCQAFANVYLEYVVLCTQAGARGASMAEKKKQLTELIQPVVGQDRLDAAEAFPPLRRVLVEDLLSIKIRKPSSGVSFQSQQRFACPAKVGLGCLVPYQGENIRPPQP